MRALLLCTRYPFSQDDSWLTSELAEELVNTGREVTVLCIDWKGSSRFSIVKSGDITIYYTPALNFGLGKVELPIKWLLSSLVALVYFLVKGGRALQYDIFISFSPCVASWASILWGKMVCRVSYLIYWDFFPIHNAQIGKVKNKPLLLFLKKIEKSLVSMFDNVGCMSPKNIQFYKDYFGTFCKQKVYEVPIWTKVVDFDSNQCDLRRKLNYEESDILCVFGGQLSCGRGFEAVLNSVLAANSKNPSIKLLVFGDGELSYLVKEYSDNNADVIKYMGYVPRNKYREILRSCDIAIVSTDAKTTVSTYPSKSLDYMMCELPIVSSVENTSDFGDIVAEAGAGIKCIAGDEHSLSHAIYTLSLSAPRREQMGQAAKRLVLERHSVQMVLSKLLQE